MFDWVLNTRTRTETQLFPGGLLDDWRVWRPAARADQRRVQQGQWFLEY